MYICSRFAPARSLSKGPSTSSLGAFECTTNIYMAPCSPTFLGLKKSQINVNLAVSTDKPFRIRFNCEFQGFLSGLTVCGRERKIRNERFEYVPLFGKMISDMKLIEPRFIVTVMLPFKCSRISRGGLEKA